MAGYLTITTALTVLITTTATISQVHGQSSASVVNSISLYGMCCQSNFPNNCRFMNTA